MSEFERVHHMITIAMSQAQTEDFRAGMAALNELERWLGNAVAAERAAKYRLKDVGAYINRLMQEAQ